MVFSNPIDTPDVVTLLLGHLEHICVGVRSQAFTPTVFGVDQKTWIIGQVSAGPTVEVPVALMEVTTVFNCEGEH
uniref:Uncharacterized protein n=1 Tax=Peronospora matthiolae TaxID=2874970 RepID=A0AAV1TGB0_9STRA